MKLKTVNIHILMGTVQSGGKVNYFANGQGKANFFLATDSYKKSGDGGIERVVEYQGNIIMVQGEIRSYTKDGIITKFTQAEKCSLMGNDMDLKK